MTKQERIKLLQNQVQDNRIDIDKLEEECKHYGIDLFDEVIHPIGYNLCDRCGDFGDSEQGFLWVDCFDWQDDNPKDQAVIKAMEQEGIDYCALCWDCVNKLAEKGGLNANHN